ncbi:MAG TPA: FecR family protein [Spirochaetota bacterium]|nr:FecR family protein [Spirochaetota bacterium]
MKRIISILIVMFLVYGCGSKTEKKIMIGLVNFVTGSVYIISSDGKETPAAAGIPVDRGMKIRTKGENSLCEIYIDENVIKVFGNTEVSIETLTRDKKTDVEKTYLALNKGKSFFKIKNKLMKDQDFVVKTNTCTAAVRGTEFFVIDNGKTSTVACLDGKVRVKSTRQNKSIEIEKDEQVVAGANSKLIKNELNNKQSDAFEKDAEVKPVTEKNSSTFDNIESGNKTTLTSIRKKLKELRTPKEIKEREAESESEEGREGSGGVNLFFFNTK